MTETANNFQKPNKMENTVKKITDLKGKIRDLEVQIHQINTLPYYEVFHRENERERDLKECREKLKQKYNELHSLLEKLTQEVLGELSTLSYMQRENTLQSA